MSSLKEQINELLTQAEKDYKNTALTKLTNHIHYGEIQALKKVLNMIDNSTLN